MASLKDQPIDIPEFERLWEEVGLLWKGIESWENWEVETGGDGSKALLSKHRKLKEIKYRLFNQLL